MGLEANPLKLTPTPGKIYYVGNCTEEIQSDKDYPIQHSLTLKHSIEFYQRKDNKMDKLTKEQANKLIIEIETLGFATYWLKFALESALKRDPVDAMNDVEVLYQILESRIRY